MFIQAKARFMSGLENYKADVVRTGSEGDEPGQSSRTTRDQMATFVNVYNESRGFVKPSLN